MTYYMTFLCCLVVISFLRNYNKNNNNDNNDHLFNLFAA